jgi:hypothetical protein
MKRLMIVAKQEWKILDKRWLICCLLFFVVVSCHQPAPGHSKTALADSIAQVQLVQRAFTQLRLLQPIIHSGDLVTRTGNDFTSESLRDLNQRDKTFSHCGIASIENDTVFIYHALGGEFNPDQKIKREPLILFGEAYSNRGIGVFRYSFNPEEVNNLVAAAIKWYNDGVKFDMKFDLQSDDRMYCAEYVYKALFTTTKGQLTINKSRIQQFEYVGIDDLFLHRQCVEVKRILYK